MNVWQKYKTVNPEKADPFERFQMDKYGNVVRQWIPITDYDGDYDQVAQGKCIEALERPETQMNEE